MIETLRRPTPPTESFSLSLAEDPGFQRFQAPFEQLASSLAEGGEKIQLGEITGTLWAERNQGAPEAFPLEEKDFTSKMKVIIKGACCGSSLIVGEREPVIDSQGRQNGFVRRYSPQEMVKLGIISWFYLEDVKLNHKRGQKAGRG